MEMPGMGQPPPAHSFGAGCQGFRHVTDILPIQGISCPFTQLLAGSIQSTGETHVDYLVPKETIAGPLGQALVLVTASIHWGPGTMPSAASAFIVSRKEDGAPGSKSHGEKVVELGCEPRRVPAFGCGGGGRMSSDVHPGLASLEDLPLLPVRS